MARVAAYVPDLLFGSNVIGAMRAAGHQAELVSSVEVLDVGVDVLVVDLPADTEERIDTWARSANTALRCWPSTRTSRPTSAPSPMRRGLRSSSPLANGREGGALVNRLSD